MENFQVDVILNSLQDLKQVRDKKERRLAQEYGRRVALESKLEGLTTQHSAASLRKTQALEGLKVVSEHASLTEAQASSLEQRCREKREEVRTINEKMEEQRQLEEKALSDFSVKMTELAAKFRNARTYYTEDKLMSEAEDCTGDIQDCRERVSSKRATLSQLQGDLPQLQCEKTEKNGAVSRETWQNFLELVTNERGVAKTALHREEESLRSLAQQTTHELADDPISQTGGDQTITDLTKREE